MIILNGMLYEMLMLFQGKRLVIVCSKQFRILIKMQSNFAKNPFFVLFQRSYSHFLCTSFYY